MILLNLKYVLEKEKITSCTKFDEIFLQTLNKYTPPKRKLLRANHASYIFKPLKCNHEKVLPQKNIL